MIRNYGPFNTRVLPPVALNCFHPFRCDEIKAHLLLTKAITEPVFYRSSELPSIPLITIWEVRSDGDELHGYVFQTGKQIVTHSALHLMVQSPSLTKHFSPEDAQAEGELVRVIRTDYFSAFHYSLGATLLARRANALMSQILDKTA